MNLLAQNQTTQPLMFRMVDETDGYTPETGLTPTVTISKNGGAFGAVAGAVTEIGNGWYKVAGNATDANTVGNLSLYATGTGARPWSAQYLVMQVNPLAAAIAANLTHVGGTANASADVTFKSINAVNGSGIGMTISGTGGALALTSSGSAHTVFVESSDGHAVLLNATGGHGLYVQSFDGAAFRLEGATDGLFITGANGSGIISSSLGGNGDGFTLNGSGTGTGLRANFVGTLTANLTGNVGGNVEGNVLGSVDSVATTVNADMIEVSGSAAAADAIEAMLTGATTTTLSLKRLTLLNDSGNALSIVSTDDTAVAISGQGVGLDVQGTSGSISAPQGIAADITGDITGNLSGSVGSVTGNVDGDVSGSVAEVTNVNAIADALLDRANGIETGITPRQAMRAYLARLCGVASGGGTATITFKNPAGTSTRVVLTGVDGSSNRTGCTLTL